MELYFDELVIVESLPIGDRKTGSELHQHLTHRQSFPVPVTLERVFSAAELTAKLHGLAARAERGTWKPMVHIEVHGNEDGCESASTEFIPWDDVATPLRRLNVAVRNSLVVAMAACKGAYFAKAAAGHPLERAPFCGIVGPDATAYDVNLLYGFREYYLELVQTRDFQLALHKLQETWLPECRAFDSGDIFRDGIANYMRRWLSGPILRERVTGIIRRHARAGTQQRRGRKVSRREIARELHNNRERIDRYWRYFVMADIYSKNEVRFQLLEPSA